MAERCVPHVSVKLDCEQSSLKVGAVHTALRILHETYISYHHYLTPDCDSNERGSSITMLIILLWLSYFVIESQIHHIVLNYTLVNCCAAMECQSGI